MPDKVQKFIESLDEKLRDALKKKLAELRNDPYEAHGVIKMKGLVDTYRLRIGRVRILYIITKEKSIEIIDIDYRGNIY